MDRERYQINATDRVRTMDWALLVSCLSFVAAGASAIMAWASRYGALQAQKAAEQANQSALAIAEDSATALREANTLTAAAQRRESLATRRALSPFIAEWTGYEIAIWRGDEGTAARLGKSPDFADRRLELTNRLITVPEEGIHELLMVLRELFEVLHSIKPSDEAVDVAQQLVVSVQTSWIETPEEFTKPTQALLDTLSRLPEL